ncbi:MAG: hypothetical protein PHY74_07420 [Candidatus Bathyarchaeota archaeon]|nr:hypothetical protein [Candidatus Bathyarchaeota archaeon]
MSRRSMSSVEEKIETVKSRFISGNLFAVFWVILGTLACWIVNPLFGWVFLGFAFFSIYIIIRRMLCNSCYYCKSCTKGFAKLSILFLGADHIPGITKTSLVGMTVFIFIVLLVIPASVLASSLLAEYSLVKLILLVGLVVTSLIALIIRLVNRNKALWKP